MSTKTKKIAGIAGSTLLLAGMGVSGISAYADDGAQTLPSAEQQTEAGVSNRVQSPYVLGRFAFSQATVTANDVIAKASNSARYLCGSSLAAPEATPSVENWTITVGGEVAAGYSATIEQLIDEEETRTMIMGCNCQGNPADGNATINAEVSGVAVGALIAKAQPSRGVNTVVFESADGYQVALPLNYVYNRFAPLVFDVNGSPLVDSVGGTNQLWLGSTSARYFARDIISITLETRQTPPPAPGTDEAADQYANLPNIGIAYGGTVA